MSKPGIREKIRARKGGIVRETLDGLGDVGIVKLDTAAMIELGKQPVTVQNRGMVARCVMDDAGEPVFTDAADVDTIEYVLFQQLLKLCYRHNGIKEKIDDASGN